MNRVKLFFWFGKQNVVCLLYFGLISQKLKFVARFIKNEMNRP
jgi:hypothetical protein